MRAVLAIIFLCGAAAAQDSVTLINTMPEPIEIWIHFKDDTRSGPIPIGRNQSQSIPLAKKGKYYLTIRDSLKRDLRVGWVDLHEIAKDHNQVALLALYQARGFLRTVPTDYGAILNWTPIGKSYAWKVQVIPFQGGLVPVNEEIVFVNDPTVCITRSFLCADVYK